MKGQVIKGLIIIIAHS